MQIVLTHVQRLVLRRLAGSQPTLSFIQIVPNRSSLIRRQYRIALNFLLEHGYVAIDRYTPTEFYRITALGRRELYPRASRDNV